MLINQLLNDKTSIIDWKEYQRPFVIPSYGQWVKVLVFSCSRIDEQ